MESLERDLETAKATIGRNTEALAKSLEEQRALEGELDQIHNVAQLIVSEVFGSAPSTSAPAIRLAEVSDEVWALIIDRMFYGTSGVLTSMVTHHPNLDFTTICSGYADGWSAEDIHSLGESLLPHAKLVAEQVSPQWVLDARHADMAEGTRQEDIAQPVDGVEPRSDANVAPPPTEPSVAPSESEQPLSSPVVPAVDVAGQPQ